jgi:uncharacterized alpha-E superfamily protein
MHHHTIIAEGARESAHDIVQVALWLSLLRASSGAEAFMKKHQGRVSAQAVVSFLLFENSFPRSVYYCLRSSRSILRDIWPEANEGATARESALRLGALLGWLDAQKAQCDVAQVHAIVTRVVDDAATICNAVSSEIQGPPRPAAAAKLVQPTQ